MAKTSNNEIIKINGYKFKTVVVNGVKRLIPDVIGNVKNATDTTKKICREVVAGIKDKLNEVDAGVGL